MKTKKFDKKLALNKTTITNLGDAMMKKALGGKAPASYPGETCLQTCYNPSGLFTCPQAPCI